MGFLDLVFGAGVGVLFLVIPILVDPQQLVVNADLHRRREFHSPGDGRHVGPDLQQPLVQVVQVGEDVGCGIPWDLGPGT